MSFLSGWKTHIASAAGIIVAGLTALGFIPYDIGSAILVALGFTSQMTMREGIKTEAKRAAQQLANPQPPA